MADEPIVPDAPDFPIIPDPIEPPVDDPDKPLGPEGEKALNIWKQEARDAKAEVKRLQAIEAQHATLVAAQMTEQERALATARTEAADEARNEVLGTVNARLFAAELKVAASAAIPTADGKHIRLADPSLLTDPEVALRLLGLGEIPVTDSGDIDTEAISTAVAALVAAKPYLAASATPAPGSADQGTRTPPPGAKDLATQIRDAETAGDWGLAGQLKLQMLAATPRP